MTNNAFTTICQKCSYLIDKGKHIHWIQCNKVRLDKFSDSTCLIGKSIDGVKNMRPLFQITKDCPYMLEHTIMSETIK